jgi:nitroreductase
MLDLLEASAVPPGMLPAGHAADSQTGVSEGEECVLDTFEAILGRRSIRRFTDQPIRHEVLEQLVDAARWSPNGNNNNLWRFVVVTSAVQKRLLLRFAPGVFDMPAAFVVVCMEPKGKRVREATRMLHVADAAIACQNIALAAHALGIGSCIIASFTDVALRTILNMPDSVSPYLMVTLGYPDESPEPPPRLPIAEIAFVDEYGKEWAQ